MTLDNNGYVGDYIIFGFSFAKHMLNGIFEIEKRDLCDQLRYPYLEGIKDTPFNQGESTKRITVTLKDNKSDILQQNVNYYQGYKTALDYTLTLEHINPVVQMKFTVVRNPLKANETIEEFF